MINCYTNFSTIVEHKNVSATALILEGGGMRGLYSSGVLDFFLDNNIEFDEVVGVSMGACNAVSFVSKQPKRNISIPMNFLNDKRYLSYMRWLCGGELFGMDFIFQTIPYELDKFDFETFAKSDTRLNIVTTDCISGEAKYFNNFSSHDELLYILRSSSSLPFVAKPIFYEGHTLMDGGIIDPIPLHFTQSLGVKKIVLVLTQPKSFKKSAFKLNKILSLTYPKYLGLQKVMKDRHINYNNIVDEINTLEYEGKIFVIRPQQKLSAKRVDKDKKRIMQTYSEGIKDASSMFSGLKKYLEI